MRAALCLYIIFAILFSAMVVQDMLVDAACPKFCKRKANDGKCDEECNTNACKYDAGDCNKPSNSNQAYEYMEYYEYIGYENNSMEYERSPKSTRSPTKSPTTSSPTLRPTKPTKKPTKPTRNPTTTNPTRRPTKPTQSPIIVSPTKSKTRRPTVPKI